MINPFKEINWTPVRTDLRKFGWSLIIGFPIIALVFFLAQWMKGHVIPPAHFYVTLGSMGAATGLVCLFVPCIAKPLYYIWYGIAACIGLVMANLIFTVLFYAIFTPMALAIRLLGRDALNLKWKKTAASHWKDAAPPPPASQYFRQY